MRRAPAQCSAEEQVEQAALLGDLVQLRALRHSVENLAGPRQDLLVTYWPELAALLAPARRSTGGKPRSTAGQPAQTLGGLYDALAPENDGAPTNDQPSTPPIEPATPAPADETKPTTGPDLAHLLLEALTVQGRALNTTQMLAWLNERGTSASREDVMNTLFGHEELFKRRGPGHWLVAGRET
jgi:hypothetical protein